MQDNYQNFVLHFYLVSMPKKPQYIRWCNSFSTIRAKSFAKRAIIIIFHDFFLFVRIVRMGRAMKDKLKMKRNKALQYITILLSLFGGHCYASTISDYENERTKKPPISLNLKRLTKEIFINNSDLKIEKYKVFEKSSLALKEMGEFDWTMTYSLTYSDNDTPSSSSLDGGGTASSVQSGSQAHSLSFSKTFFSGTKIETPLTFSRDTSTSSFTSFPVSKNTSAGITITQPLLRLLNRGYFYRKYQEAKDKFEMSKSDEKKKMAKTLIKTIEQYFEVIKLQQDQKLHLFIKENDQRNLEFLQAKKRLGKSSRVELLGAESSLAKSDEKLINTEIKLFKKRNELAQKVFGSLDQKYTLSFNQDEFEPLKKNLQMDLDKVYKKAYKRRPEGRKFEKDVALHLRKLNYSKTDMLPELEMSHALTSKGLAADTGTSKDQVLDGKFLTYKGTLSLEAPLLRYAKKGNLGINKSKLMQAKLKLKNYKLDLRLEIESGLKELLGQEKISKALSLSSKAQEEKFEYYQKRFKLGQISIFDFTKVQQDMQRAKIEYHEAQNKYYKLFIKALNQQGEIQSLL
jgi:outer membrane protein TolC